MGRIETKHLFFIFCKLFLFSKLFAYVGIIYIKIMVLLEYEYTSLNYIV